MYNKYIPTISGNGGRMPPPNKVLFYTVVLSTLYLLYKRR